MFSNDLGHVFNSIWRATLRRGRVRGTNATERVPPYLVAAIDRAIWLRPQAALGSAIGVRRLPTAPLDGRLVRRVVFEHHPCDGQGYSCQQPVIPGFSE